MLIMAVMMLYSMEASQDLKEKGAKFRLIRAFYLQSMRGLKAGPLEDLP